MDSQASKEKRFVSTIEKVVMYVMYAVFGVINGAIIFSGDYEALFRTGSYHSLLFRGNQMGNEAGKMKDMFAQQRIKTI